MTIHSLLPALALALFIAYSIIVTLTSGAAAAIASPMLVAAIGSMIWHDRLTEAA